jgi:hypothetical protein
MCLHKLACCSVTDPAEFNYPPGLGSGLNYLILLFYIGLILKAYGLLKIISMATKMSRLDPEHVHIGQTWLAAQDPHPS